MNGFCQAPGRVWSWLRALAARPGFSCPAPNIAARMEMRVEFSVLGPVEAKADGRTVEVGRRMYRAVLAMLL